MNDVEAFKIYLAVRLAFLENAPEIILQGKYPKRWASYLPSRRDFNLVGRLMKISDGTKRGLFRLCVGNLLYGNKDFLYSEEHTSRLMKNHIKYLNECDSSFEKDLDVLQIRIYTFKSIEEYYKSNKLLDDIYSRSIHMETLCMLHSINPKFIPSGGYLFENIIQRIRIGSLFIPVSEKNKNLALNKIVSSSI